MKVLTYIWHDCFVYDSENIKIVFDFWKDPTLSGQALPSFLSCADKPVYVLVSHHHKDHYNKEIFGWQESNPDIRYIVSKDVARHARHIINENSIYSGRKPLPGSVTILTPGETYADEFLTVEAFSSTDIGNSYVVIVDGISIFHAGDLNAWIWKDESTELEVSHAIMAFESILDTIYTRYQSFDIAMFPVDARIGRDYWTGAKIFVNKFDVRHFFPMHFGLGDTVEIQRFFQQEAARVYGYANRDRGEYICLQAPYSTFAMI